MSRLECFVLSLKDDSRAIKRKVERRTLSKEHGQAKPTARDLRKIDPLQKINGQMAIRGNKSLRGV